MSEKNIQAAAKAVQQATASLKPPAVKSPQQVLNELARNSYKQGYIR